MAVDDVGSGLPASADLSVEQRPAGALPSGSELVGLSERFYARVFVGSICFVGLAALAAFVLLPIVQFTPGAPVAAAAIATGVIVAATPLALYHARTVYCALRRSPVLQLVLVLFAALLIADPRLSSELWWPSCAILMALAIVAPLSWALAYCALALCANLAGHAIANDVAETPAVEIIGLWIGYPLWVAMIAIVTDRFVAYLVLLSATPPAQPEPMPPRRVDASARAPSSGAAGSSPPEAASGRCGLEGSKTDSGERTTAHDKRTTARLTARQLQVVALLADGLRYREVAACLSISERQVQRHIGEAIIRLGLRTPYELTALAMSEGITPIRPDH